MNIKRYTSSFSVAYFFLEFFTPVQVLATQAHGAPEGIYAHQVAHIFFMLSMGILIYWLRERRLVQNSGWRYIQYSAIFLILWNIDAFIVHFLDEQIGIVQIEKLGQWHVQIQAQNGNMGIEILYYCAKLDHLLCVPALFFLYLGFRRLLKENRRGYLDPNHRNQQP